MEATRTAFARQYQGFGKKVPDISYRSIQWLWVEAYLFIDSRTQAMLETLGSVVAQPKLLKP